MKIKMMFLLGMVCGLQCSENKNFLVMSDLAHAVFFTINDFVVKPECKKFTMKVCCFNPGDAEKLGQPIAEFIKGEIVNVRQLFREDFHTIIGPIKMITPSASPVIEIFNVQSKAWSIPATLRFFDKDDAVVVYNLFGNQKPNFDLLRQLKDANVSVVINLERSPETLESIKKAFGTDVTVLGNVVTQRFVGYKKYIFVSLTFAGLVTLYLYNKDFFVTQFFAR